MLAVYLTVIVSEGDNTFFDILPWALSMTIAAGMAFAGALIQGTRIARNLLLGAAALFGVLGVLGMLTIGFGFLLAAATAVGATRV
jgi:hypothetical protein